MLEIYLEEEEEKKKKSLQWVCVLGDLSGGHGRRKKKVVDTYFRRLIGFTPMCLAH